MTSRRSIVFGAACLGAAGLAYALKPRKSLNLLGDRKMQAIIPASVGAWVSSDHTALVQPNTEGTLAAQLYSELVGRLYVNQQTGGQVMMLVAYGDTQSDLLQLHRPEACYPAIGFHLASAATVDIPLNAGLVIPGRRVVARMADRQENIVYWTRLGDYLPTDPAAQRESRLLMAMKGYVADGALFRFSAIGDDQAGAFRMLDGFVAELVHAVRPSDRPALVGGRLAGAVV